MNHAVENPNDYLTVRQAIELTWEGKWVIIVATASLIMAGVVYALSLPNYYTSEVLLATKGSEGNTGLSALAAQYGGLASAAGISLGATQSNKTAIALEILQSRSFLIEFIESRDILVPLMAAKTWKRGSDTLVIDAEIYDPDNAVWVRDVESGENSIPSALEAYGRLSDLLLVSHDDVNGLTKVSLEFMSPSLAQQWLAWLIEDIDGAIRDRDVGEAKQSVAFLKLQLQSTSLAGLQEVFYRLIEEQLKTIVLAEASEEYMFRVIDPPVIPELKSGPSRSIIVIVFAVLGSLLGVVVVLARNLFKTNSISTR